ncbi:hypothetical protein BJ165DRAFT_1533483 [Panaeolus papilionaceus]|nr:hypothetical protein BJ165DRAFT_1533483 [Panaeolus papilionaceus]
MKSDARNSATRKESTSAEEPATSRSSPPPVAILNLQHYDVQHEDKIASSSSLEFGQPGGAIIYRSSGYGRTRGGWGVREGLGAQAGGESADNDASSLATVLPIPPSSPSSEIVTLNGCPLTKRLSTTTVPTSEHQLLHFEDPHTYVIHLPRTGWTNDGAINIQTAGATMVDKTLKLTVANILGDLEDDEDFARGEVAWCDPCAFLQDKQGIPVPMFRDRAVGHHPLVVIGRYTRLLGTDPCLLVLPCTHRLYPPLDKYKHDANDYTRNTRGYFVKKWGNKTQMSLSLGTLVMKSQVSRHNRARSPVLPCKLSAKDCKILLSDLVADF